MALAFTLFISMGQQSYMSDISQYKMPQPSLLTHIYYTVQYVMLLPLCPSVRYLVFNWFLYVHTQKKNLAQVQLTLHNICQHNLCCS